MWTEAMTTAKKRFSEAATGKHRSAHFAFLLVQAKGPGLLPLYPLVNTAKKLERKSDVGKLCLRGQSRKLFFVNRSSKTNGNCSLCLCMPITYVVNVFVSGLV